jgi:hypothetical protein
VGQVVVAYSSFHCVVAVASYSDSLDKLMAGDVVVITLNLLFIVIKDSRSSNSSNIIQVNINKKTRRRRRKRKISLEKISYNIY